MNGISIGVIGCADIAVRRVLPALSAQPGSRLVAVASREQDKADRVAKAFGCAGIAGYDRLLERDDVDAVYIPLPPALHYEWVARALAAGKHVLVEKPLCTSYAQAQEVVRLAQQRNLILSENFMFLHHSQHRELRSIVASGGIGRVQIFAGLFAVPPLNPASYRYQPALGGGALLDTGVYPLRAAQLFLGSELEVLGACLRVDSQTGVDVAGSALLCTPDGISAQLDFGFEHTYRSRYSLWGLDGHLSALRAFTPPASMRPPVRLEQQDRLTEFTLEPDDQVNNCMAAFVAAVVANRRGSDEALLAQARLLEEIRQAAQIIES